VTAVHFDSTSAARSNFKALLDAAREGRTASLRRDDERVAVVDVARLVRALTRKAPPEAVLVAEAGGWSAFLPGFPVSGSGASFDEAVGDLVVAMREYTEDWNDHLRLAPNHADNWALVQLVDLSSDDELRRWVIGKDR
jgi:hypothetical protein